MRDKHQGLLINLVNALAENVHRYPSQRLLDSFDDDDMSGCGPAPVNRQTTIGEVRRWRILLKIAQKELELKG